MKTKLKQVLPKPNNTSIIIYYSHDGKEMRYPTGVAISNEKIEKGVNKGNYKDWDYSTNMLRTYVTDFNTKKAKILELAEKANTYISEQYKAGIMVGKEELEEFLAKGMKAQGATLNTTLLEFYEDFLQMKRTKFEAKGTIASLKNYTSTRNLFQDFEAVKKKKYKLHEITKFWLDDITTFMRNKPPEMAGTYRLKRQDKMNESTIGKRFDVFKEYFEYLKDMGLNLTDLIERVKKYKSKEIKAVATQKETLTIDEIHQLYNYQFEDERLEKIKDVFVFTCFTGIRFQDLSKFDASFIVQNVEGHIYKRTASKTRNSSAIKYNIPLCDIVLEILKKYDKKLPVISNQKSNEYLKEALQETGYFDEVTEIIDKETGEYKRRYEALSMHKARNTFITNLVGTVPLNELMKYTGHSKLSTLQGYIDPRRDVKPDYIKIFNPIKIA